MDITDYIPNVFGYAAPTSYDSLQTMGLISPQQAAQQQKTANIQGLLGAGLALAQGMSAVGPRRSAAENILGALAGGFGAAGGAYQQGIQNVVQQQQLQSAALQQAQAANRLKAIQQAKTKYPDLAPLADIDPGKFAEEVALKERFAGMPGGTGNLETPDQYRNLGQRYLAGGPNFKAIGDSYMQQADVLELTNLSKLTGKESVDELRNRSFRASALKNEGLAKELMELASRKQLEPPVIQPPAEQPPQFDTEGKPVMTVVADRGRAGQLQLKIDGINSEIDRLIGVNTEAADKRITRLESRKETLQKDMNRLAAMEYDFKSIKDGLPKKYHGEIDAVEKLAQTGTLDSSGIRSSVEKFYTRLQEDEKGRKLEGNTALFAQMKFGVTDRAQLNGEQLAEILRFENAPNAEQVAKLQQTNRQLQFETGAGVGLPSGKASFITGGTTTTTEIAPQPAVVREPTAAKTTAPAKTTAAVTNVQTTTQAAPKFAAPENAPPETKAFYSYNKDALINQPDSKYSPKKKMELREKQAPLQSAVNYSLTSIKDSLDAAQALKNNPKYIDALTGRFSPLLGGTIAGVVIDQDAKTANALLENILTRTFVSEIQAMRDASPTGGAVGSVTEKEMDALSRIRASLSVGMNKDEFIKQLDNYLAIANRSLKNIPVEYSKTFGYNGEFDEILTKPAISTTRTSGQDPVQQELDRRKGRKP
jgi:hypothetical protein